MKPYVAYILQVKKGFRPILGSVHESEGDNDSLVYTEASGERQPTLQEAIDWMRANPPTPNPEDYDMYEKPVQPTDMGMWLSVIKNANQSP